MFAADVVENGLRFNARTVMKAATNEPSRTSRIIGASEAEDLCLERIEKS